MKTQPTISVINLAELLQHEQVHCSLNRRVIEVFQGKEFFKYSLGKRRTFSAMRQKFLAIAVPCIRQIAEGSMEDLN